MKWHSIAALVAAFLFPTPARADSTATFANILALEQATDALQTHHGLDLVECRYWHAPQNPILEHTCWKPFREGDPLARPFVHSLATSLVAGAVLNVGFREIHSPIARVALRIAVFAYPLILIHNARAMHVSTSFRL